MTDVTVSMSKEQAEAFMLAMASNGVQSGVGFSNSIASGVGRTAAFVANTGTVAMTTFRANRTEEFKSQLRLTALRDEVTRQLKMQLRRAPTEDEVINKMLVVAPQVFK